MATMTFTCDSTNRIVHTSGGTAANPRCDVNTVSVGAKSSSFSFTLSTSSKSLTKGNGIIALPFTGIYTECVPMAGRFQIDTHSASALSDDVWKRCGDRAGTKLRYSADIGYFVNTASSVPAPTPSPALLDSLRKQADTKACADLRRSLYNAPLILAERKETINTLKKKGLQIAAAVKYRQSVDLQRWLKSRSADKRRVARDISEEHLVFMFGLLPLISEIDGICGALKGDTPSKITGRGRASQETKTRINRSSLNPSVDTNHGIANYVAFTESVEKLSHRTSVSCTVTMSGAQYFRDAGLNPIAAAYDLVPLSFLSDFVSNLGTFLRALDPLIGVDFLTGSSTSWLERRDTTDVVGIEVRRDTAPSYPQYPSFLKNRCSGQGKGYTRYLSVKRSVLTDYPDPSLMWVNNMTLGKAGTLASLAIQRYLKPVQRLFAVKTFRYRGPRPRYLPPINYR